MEQKSEQIRYPETFKKKVISEIKSGQINAHAAGIKYGIGGKMTIYNWLKKAKKEVSLPIMKTPKDEKNTDAAELIREIEQLKKELQKAQLKAEANEILVQIAKEKYGIDLGKLGAKR